MSDLQDVQVPLIAVQEIGMLHLQLAAANQEIARLRQALDIALAAREPAE